MAGTEAGGKKAAAKNMARDPNFYKKIGSKGGSSGEGADYRLGGSKASGFAADPERARTAGVKGGQISRRKGQGYIMLKNHVDEIERMQKELEDGEVL